MDEMAARLLERFAKGKTKIPLQRDWKRFYEFLIYIHQQSLLISAADIVEHLVANGLPIDEARRVSWIFIHGAGLLLEYDITRDRQSASH